MTALTSNTNLTAFHVPTSRMAQPSQAADRITITFPAGAEWDEIASQFDDALHEQSHCFNSARWGEEHVENIVFKQGGTVIGGASMILLNASVIGTGIAIAKWGPLWRKTGETPDLSRLSEIFQLLKEEYAERRGFYLTIMPPADPEYGSGITSRLEHLGFTQGSSLPAPERYLVDVSLNESELRQSLSQKWRYNLKKSEHHNFEISFSEDQEGFEAFIRLYEAMLERKQFNDTSAIRTLKRLMRSETPAFRPRIVLMSHEGSLTAGAVVDLSGDQAVYLYGATDDRALKLNAGYALHWFIASFLRNRREIRRYDLGGNDLDGGLRQFKKGFVGKHGTICETPPNYHYGASLKAQLFGKTVFMLRDLKQAIIRKLHS